MFTLLLKIKSETRLASHITVLQHLTALSFVHAVRSIPGYQVRIVLFCQWVILILRRSSSYRLNGQMIFTMVTRLR